MQGIVSLWPRGSALPLLLVGLPSKVLMGKMYGWVYLRLSALGGT